MFQAGLKGWKFSFSHETHGDFFCRQKKSEARRATEEDSVYPALNDCLGRRDRRALGSGMSGWRQTSVFLSWYTTKTVLKIVRSAPFLNALHPPKTLRLTFNPFPPTPFLVLPVLRGVCTEECRVGKPSRWIALRKIHFSLLPRLQPPDPAQLSPPSRPAVWGWSPVCVLLR